MKIHTLKEKIIAAATKRSHLKKISFILAAALIINLIPALFPHVNAEEDDASYISDAASDLPDSRELERMYIEQLFYGNGISFYKDYGRTALEGVQLEIYESLRSEIEKVAAGERTETVFTVELSTPYNDSAILQKDLSSILRYLLTDLPQDFYWYDKTKSGKISMSGHSDGSTIFYTECEISFDVSENYADKSAATSEGRYLTVNPARINAAKTAVKNAQEIAAEYNDRSDYEKILGYKNRICNLTEYNHEAAENKKTPYGDPWQLVYVFDDDPDTNVVCEGYSKAFQYLCDLGGIECYTVMGNLSAGTGAGGHMWNVVVLNGKSYLADITNCDGDSVGSPDLLLLKGATQSSSEGCTFNLSQTVIYTYDNDALELYTDDILTVSTEDFDPNVHSDHRVCVGAENCPDDIHGEHQNLEWTEWSDDDTLPTEAGNYYLTEDVTLAESWDPADGTSLCLNGHTITAENINSEVINIGDNITFNLCDCTDSGKISGNTTSYHGGGVHNSGIFNMYSGNISENTAYCGSGVYNTNIFNMYGGEIGGNNAIDDIGNGGGVYTQNLFNMYGGKISGNNAKNGGGVYSDAIFNMYGGKIIENTAEQAGGVCTYDIYTCRLTLGGNAVIKDNTCGDKANNLYTCDTITVDKDKPLSEGAYIGITTENKPTEDNPVNVTGENDNDYSQFFHSDDAAYEVVNGENNVVQLGVYTNTHKHTVCKGADNCPDEIHGEHQNVEWTEWNKVDALPTEAGNYYLTEDVTLTESWKPADGTSLCLNGHTVSAQKAASGIIYIDTNKITFNLCDCQGVGKISGNNLSSTNYGGGVTNKGIFNMYSGKISGNTSGNGGGVYSSGTNSIFNMYGGEISGNTSNNNGGVYNANGSTFNMYNGKISVNTSSNGGGVYNTGTSSTFNMYAGEISGNTSNNNGGGVYNSSSKFNMYSGEISGNTSTKNGGGVYNYGPFKMLGGEISGNTANVTTGGGGVYAYNNNFTIGGNAVIKDNNCDDSPDDLYLYSSYKITIDAEKPLTGDAYIGIRTNGKPTETSNVQFTQKSDTDYSEFFHSNNSQLSIIYKDNALWLRLTPHGHTVCVGADNCPDDIHGDHELLEWTKWSTKTSLPTKSGCYFLDTDVTLKSSWKPVDGVSLCLNGHTISAENAASGIIYIRENITFNLCDCASGSKISGNTVSDDYCGGGVTNNGKFNMYSGEIGENTSNNTNSLGAGGVYNSGTNSTFNMYGGEISGNTSNNNGGGVYSSSSSTFNMYGGKITENNASKYGGGVYNLGTFNLYGGAISGNISKSYSGGVENRGILNMYGGKISENKSVTSTGHGIGGGIHNINNNTIFNMYGGEISGNITGYEGGGVDLDSGSTFNMYSGEISGNTANRGGGVYNHSGTFNMKGGKICENTAQRGGGVYNHYLKFYMYEGEIIGNTSQTAGGGICNESSYAMYGGKISQNIACSIGGGGVYSSNSNVIIGGDAVIKDNNLNGDSDDFYLLSNMTVTIDANNPLTGDAYIGIKTQDEALEGLYIKITTENGTDYSEFFHSNNPDCIIRYIDNSLWLRLPAHEHIVCTGVDCPDDIHGEHELVEWEKWSDSTALPTDSGYYFLAADVILTESWEPAESVSLCLNGHTIYAENAESGIICIGENNTFNLCDCQGVGKISGNTVSDTDDNTDYDGYFGGVTNNGTFNMYSGEISENTANENYNGGGVYNLGTFNMYNGKISGNASSIGDGGGVYNGGTFNMYGGEISGNTAKEKGGGLYIPVNGIFNMYGGEIIGNTAEGTIGGGGVYTYSSKVIIGGDAVIKDNTCGDKPDNLYILDTITVDKDKPLSEDAYIGITTETKPTWNNPVNITGENDNDYSEFFHSDDAAYEIVNGENNVVQLANFIRPHAHTVCEGADNCPDYIHSEHQNVEWTAWESETELPSESGYYYLTKDVTLSGVYAISAGMDIKLCLNGKTVMGADGSNIVINPSTDGVKEGSFSLCDCEDGGRVTVLSDSAAIDNKGCFYLYDGTITNERGNGVYSQGTFNMYGGSVENNGQSGVSNQYGTFTVYGGTIKNNDEYGVSNADSASFIMNGGTIAGNGSGVKNAGSFTMTVGSIEQNKIDGVWNYGGIFTMTGGSIGNNAENGVSNTHGGIFTMLGGKISENPYGYTRDGSAADIFAGGNAVINNNSKCNVYLLEGDVIVIDLNNPLAEGAYIGVTTYPVPTDNNPVNITGANSGDYMEYFHSDNPDYKIICDENGVIQLMVPHVHSLEYHGKVKPTCTEKGNEDYWVCKNCEKIFADENGETELDQIPEIAATGHKWGKWTITIEPRETEGSKGEAERVCENNNEHIDTVQLPELTDKTVWTLIEHTPSTCKDEGKRVYTSEYGTVTVTLEKISHEYEKDWHKDNEKHWQICKNCGTVNPYSENPHTWDEGTVTVPPTTDHDGEKTFSCGICGHTKTEKIDKLPVTESEESSSESEPEESSTESEPEESSTESEPEESSTESTPEESSTESTPEESSSESEPEESSTESTPEESSSESEPEESSSESMPEESSSESTPEDSSSESEPEESSSESEPEESSSESEPEESSSESEPEESSSESEPEESSSESEPEESSSESEPEESSSESEPEESSSESEPEESSSESEPEESSSESEPEESSSESEPEESSEEPIVTPETSDSEPDVNTSYPNVDFVIPDIETSGTSSAEQSNSSTETAPIPTDTTRPPQTTDNSQPAETEERNGTISKRVESKDYSVEISDGILELANKVLTSQETWLAVQGSAIEILLTVDDIDVISNTDGAAVRETLAKLSGYKAEQYLDINLYKIIDGTRYKVSNTNDTVTIALVIPETLRAEGREYAMIRVHDGAGDILKDLDSSADTFTFATDRFSVYALIYKDKETGGDQPLNTGTGSYISVLLAAGITSMAAAMTFSLIGMEIGGMSEERKDRIYNKLIRWGKRGGKIRTYMALGLILILLGFYYGIGMKVSDECK